MKLLYVLPLISVIAISGCTSFDFGEFCIPGISCQKVDKDTSDIVKITSFTAIPSTIAPGQSVRLIAYIENKGSETLPLKDQEGVEVNLFDYCSGLFDLLGIVDGRDVGIECPPGSSVTRGEKDEKAACTGIRLLPGEIKKIDWVLRAHNDIKLKTVCPTNGMQIQAKYSFRTSSLTTMTLINREELQRQTEQGELRTDQSYISVGEGPLEIFLTVEDQQPISTDSQTTVIALQLEDKGDGFVSKSTIPKEKITIIFPREAEVANHFVPDPQRVADCNFEQIPSDDPRYPKIPAEEQYRYYRPATEATLIKGQSAQLFCPITLPPGETIAKEETFTFQVEVEYGYEFTDSAKVTVEPKL